MAGISDEVLEVHGVAPGQKVEGVTRVLYKNYDGMNNNIGGNDKLEKAAEIIDGLEADVVMYTEHRMNLRHKTEQEWHESNLQWRRSRNQISGGPQCS